MTVSDVHVLAQDMVHRAERQRLLVFADNRQDAAFQAGWMRDHARRFRLRALMADQIRKGSISIGDLTAALDQLLDQDDDLSRALLPEVWSPYSRESEPVKHSEERRYLLRITVLREVTTGVKQRVGLEPWGRLRVEYVGLTPETPYVIRLAEEVGVSADRVADGIAALLDRMRRQLHVLDRQGQIFSRFWREGDREILRGYLPLMPGVPKALKLQREEGDDDGRVTQWLSVRGDTVVRQALRKWGVRDDRLAERVADLWTFVTEEVRLLAPATLRGSRGRTLPGCAGVYQIDANQIRLTSHKGRWRCRTCRRTQV
ncbi:MAG: DEAD/DEAH box helicase, partial [Dehalococcoidia bacterium]